MLFLGLHVAQPLGLLARISARCVLPGGTDLPRCLFFRGLSGMRPGRTLAQVAAKLVCVRRGIRARRVVLVDARTLRLINDHYPEQIVRIWVLER